MVLGGTLLVLVPLIFIGAVIYINSSRALEDISNIQTVQIATSLSSMIRTAIEKDMKILAAMAKDPSIINDASREEYDGINVKLADLFKRISTDYEALAVFDQKGIIRAEGFDKNRIGISISDRDYFQTAKKGRMGNGSIVASKATGMPIFGLCAPIMSKDGVFLGGVLGVVKADFLVRYISSLKLGKTGYAFMVDQKGIVIAHPNHEYIMKLDASREGGGMKEITEKMIRQETGTSEYVYKGEKKIIGFAPMALTGWSVGVTQHKEEVMALAYTNRNLILMVSGFFFVLTVLAVFFFSRTISAPVQKTLTTLNQAIQQATEAIIIIGLDKRVQFVNPAFAAIIDRPIQDLVGKTPDLENTNLASSEEIWKALKQGKMWSGLITGVKRDSTKYSMNMTITPVRDEIGRISCFLAIARDISRELMMEAQLRQSQKMEAIGTLAGGIAHDFNNILSAIFGYAELTLNYLGNREKSGHFLNEILKAAGRARELVNRIMTFSRQVEQQKQVIKPKYIIKEALRLLRASLPATIEIREVVKSDAAIMADPTQIHQIMMNLCTNAGYAMRQQGGILEVTLSELDVDQAFVLHHQGIEPGRHVLLKVADSGSGIPPENVDRVFDPFFTTKPQGEGTGLGLSVVHGIVKALDGMISVSSSAGKGTTFTVYLPVSKEEAPDREEKTPEDVSGGSERLLLVDDEEALVQTGKAMLEDLGYQVSAFTKSAAALEKFTSDPTSFDAVITDYTMPQITGYELTKKIREIRPDIPIILCSGYIDQDVEIKIQNVGINEFVKKPMIGRDLAVALRRIFKN